MLPHEAAVIKASSGGGAVRAFGAAARMARSEMKAVLFFMFMGCLIDETMGEPIIGVVVWFRGIDGMQEAG